MTTLRPRVVVLATLVALLACSPSLAAVIGYTWDGGNGAWTDNNWNGGNPGPGLTFGDSDPTPNVLIDSGDTIDSSADSFTIVEQSGGSDTTKITLDNGSTLKVNNLWMYGPRVLVEILDGNLEINTEVRFDGGDGNAPEIAFTKGLITLNNGHSMKGDNQFHEDDHINFLGAAGEAVIDYPVSHGSSNQSLAGRVFRGLFSIDGTVVNPGSSPEDIPVLNAELATLVVNGRYFEIEGSSAYAPHSLHLRAVTVPEPAAALLGLLCMGCLATSRTPKSRA